MIVNNKFQSDADEFKILIDVLVKSGFQRKQIAEELGIKEKGKKNDGNLSVLSRLCNGSLQSYKGISISDYVEKIQKSKLLSSKLTSTNIDATKFDFIFFFYYWSEKGMAKVAVIGINKKSPRNSVFTYLTKQESGNYITGEVHDIKLFEHENSPTIDIVTRKRNKRGSTFISAHIGSKRLDEVKLTFCSYCGAMRSIQVNYAGIGILEQIAPEDFVNYMNELNSAGIHPSIVNVLYRRRLNLHHSENDVYDSYEALNSSQREPLNHIKGYWVGYYLRRMIEGPEKSGGLVKVIMIVEESGLATINFISGEYRDSAFNERTIYSGVFQFSIENSISIIVGKFQPVYKSNRLRMLLKYDDRKLTGFFCGWRIINSGYFTTPIYFEKIDISSNNKSKEETLKALFKEYKPARYHRTKLKDKEFEYVLQTLSTIEDTVFDTVQRCSNYLQKG